MGKKQTKTRIKEILYIFFCIIDIYILPLLLNYKDVFLNLGKNEFYAAEACAAMTGWAGGFGGLMLLIGTAVYEFFACKRRMGQKSDNAVWTAVFALVPLAVYALISTVKGENSGYGVVMLYMPVVFACGGTWLGRLMAGKYKGIKQFYAADIIYILACAVLSVVCDMFLKKNVLTDIGVAFLFTDLFLLSVIYGRFSDFEYMQERALRAMLISALVFTAVAFAFCINFFDFSKIFYKEMGQSYYWKESFFNGGRKNILKIYTSFAGFISSISAAAWMGTVTGYYLRIMRVGGTDEINKKREQRQRIILYTAATAVLSVYLGYHARFWFFESVKLYDLIGADASKITAIGIKCDNYEENGFSENYTLSRESIEEIIDILKNENGVVVDELPQKHDTERYSLTAYDIHGLYFDIEMSQRGEMLVRAITPRGKYNFIIPRQYYGLEKTKLNNFIKIIRSAPEPSYTEKIRFITAREKDIYFDTVSVWEKFLTDEDTRVRELAAENVPCVNMLAKFALDKDMDVKAAAYNALVDCYFNGNNKAYYEENCAGNALFDLANGETDEKYRFYAVNCLAEAARRTIYPEWTKKSEIFMYFHGKYMNSFKDIDRLTYACAMLISGDERYCDEIKEIAKRLPDDGEYADIKQRAIDICEAKRYKKSGYDPSLRENDSSPMLRQKDIFPFSNGEYDDVNLW